MYFFCCIQTKGRSRGTICHSGDGRAHARRWYLSRVLRDKEEFANTETAETGKDLSDKRNAKCTISKEASESFKVISVGLPHSEPKVSLIPLAG